MIDERDDGQTFMDWFIHGSKKKKEQKKIQLIDPNTAGQQTSQQLQPVQQQVQPSQQQSTQEKTLSFHDVLESSSGVQSKTIEKPITQAISTEPPKSAPISMSPPKPIAQTIPKHGQVLAQQSLKPVAYQKFVISRPKLTPIPKDSKQAVYPLISPYAYTEIKDDGGILLYTVVEPVINEEEKTGLEKLKTALIHFIDLPMSSVTDERTMMNFLEEKVIWLLEETDISIPAESYAKIMYYLYRDFVGLNQLEPLLRDPYIEDIACDGVGVPIYVVHQRFGTIKTSIAIEDEDMLRELVVKLSQRCNRYISYAEPLLDGSLPDGTRVNATLARDVTSRGPTFSIRKFRDKPFSPIEMLSFKTADPDILAYMWFVVENGSNILLCGGTGTGKTSFMNTVCMFVPEEAKIVTIEDTREIRIHHENWLPAVARIGFGGTKTGEVTMFDLLKESFRQNPNYIIVGEVRGEEAAVMFQAMASGMTAMSTMHAGSADDALKRLQTRPISLPPTLMDTLDILIVMTHAYERGASARRIKEIVEIDHVDSATNKVVTNRAFYWNPVKDNYAHGKTTLLENIAQIKGYSKDYVKREMADRKKVIDWLVDKNFDWKEVTQYFAEYRRNKQKLMDLVAGKIEKAKEEHKNKSEHYKTDKPKIKEEAKLPKSAAITPAPPPKPIEAEINLNLIS
ncbi:MAG: type II/IV secretion system ATPase subunit [Candidatus Aenigmarchaeota archaeon]|nr:type II/IV secretion system ATPase subunit [Candidatus Aenigmarchaeota archaeon]